MTWHRVTIDEVMAGAQCGDHPLNLPDDFTTAGAETLIALSDETGGWDDSGSFGLARLTSGQFLVARESSDSSGHGCRCDGSAGIHASLSDAWSLGLTEDERRLAQEFGFEAPQ